MEETDKLIAEIKTLRLISELSVNPDSAHEMYYQILEGLSSLLGFDMGTIQILDEDKATLELVASLGIASKLLIPSVDINDERILSASVGRTGNSIFIPDVYQESLSDYTMHIIEELGIRSVIFWPLVGMNGHVFGVLSLASSKEQPLTERDRDSFQSVARVLGAVLERHEAVEKLKESEKKYQSLVENSLEGIVIAKDNPLRLLFVNQAMASKLEYSREELKAMSPSRIRNLIYQDDREAYFSEFSEYIQGTRKASTNVVRGLTKSGKVLYFHISATRINLENEPAVQATFVDITQRRKAAEALRKSEEKYRLLAENVRDVIWIVGLDLELTYISPSVERMLGFAPREILNNPIEMILTEDAIEILSGAIRESLSLEATQGRNVWTNYPIVPIELEAKKSDGTITWLEITRKFLRDEHDNPIGVIGVARDISLRKKAEEELNNAKASAELFSDLLAHDLTNIQQGVSMSLELLKEYDMPSEAQGLLDRALSLTEHGMELTASVKRIAKVRGETTELETVFPYQMLISAADMVVESYPQKRVILKTNLEKHNFPVLGDEFLREVFYNLLHNSVRLDPSEEVILDIQADIVNKTNQVRIQVVDRGPGIDDSLKETLFTRNGKTENRNVGLGLVLVRQILERYGAKIWVEDRVDNDSSKGTRFVILLQIAQI